MWGKAKGAAARVRPARPKTARANSLPTRPFQHQKAKWPALQPPFTPQSDPHAQVFVFVLPSDSPLSPETLRTSSLLPSHPSFTPTHAQVFVFFLNDSATAAMPRNAAALRLLVHQMAGQEPPRPPKAPRATIASMFDAAASRASGRGAPGQMPAKRSRP